VHWQEKNDKQRDNQKDDMAMMHETRLLLLSFLQYMGSSFGYRMDNSIQCQAKRNHDQTQKAPQYDIIKQGLLLGRYAMASFLLSATMQKKKITCYA